MTKSANVKTKRIQRLAARKTSAGSGHILGKILSLAFDKQKQVIQDDFTYKAVCCSRRSGKSNMAALYLIHNAIKYPGSINLYLGLTRSVVKGLMIQKEALLLTYLQQLKITYHIDMAALIIKLDNGSIIQIQGLDSDSFQAAKLLGSKLSLVIIDEAAQWRQDLEDLIYNKLGPMLAGGSGPNINGQIMLIGTPDHSSNYFYKITGPEDKRPQGWHVHNWIASDNPYMKEEVKRLSDEYLVRHPNADWDPEAGGYASYQSQYLGRWVFDANKQVYHFKEDKHIGSAPKLLRGSYYYTMGVDFGFTDAFAVTVVATHSDTKHMYVVETFKKRGLLIAEQAQVLKSLQAKYLSCTMVGDSAARQNIEELVQVYGLPIMTESKRDKETFIKWANSCFWEGLIHLDPTCEDLAKEMKELPWAPTFFAHEKRKEDPRFDNHLCDAFLYAFRFSGAYKHTPYLIEDKMSADEVYQHTLKRKMMRLQANKGSKSYYQRK